MTLRSVLQRWARSVLLALGLLAISAGVVLVAAASQTSVLAADQDLSRYWRTTYDILVRPATARSPIEERYGLVEANHLSGIAGGITFSQYEAIEGVPGVEVAAPIAMLGYVAEIVPIGALGLISDPGAYLLQETLIVEDGARSYPATRRRYYYVGDDVPPPDPATPRLNIPALRLPGRPAPVHSHIEVPFLVAAIVPSQEAALVRLDQALLEGEYLADDDPVQPDPDAWPVDPFGNPITTYRIPILINATPYVSVTARAELQRLSLPAEAASFDAMMAEGGIVFLAGLPVEETLDVREVVGEVAYGRLIERLQGKQVSGPGTGPGIIHGLLWSRPSQMRYREVEPPFAYDGLVLEIVPAKHGVMRHAWAGDEWIPYRDSWGAELEASFKLRAKGLFDIDRLPKPADVNRVPLETYFPPLATLHYDETGQPVEPRTLQPTLNPAGYIQSPPLVLTTLEAARVLCGESCISAVRVRVGDIDELTPASQRKIETVATEISRQTGLTVDVMVGSSPRRVLVQVPGIGYVEEGWIQKGVNVSYQQRIQSGHWLVLGVLLVIGGVYTLDLTWADVMARRRAIALQKALGWRSQTVFRQVVGRVLVVGTLAAVAGALGAAGAGRGLGWQSPGMPLLIGVPLAMIGLCAVGSLYPAWLASRVSPIVELQGRGTRYERRAGQQQAGGMWSHAWRNLMRRPSRTAVSAASAALAAALLVALLAVTLEQQGVLTGTLLGEFMLVRIERFHYAIVAIGFGLGALSTANALLSGILERQREIAVLKAVGWRTTDVARLFVVEGALLGLIGGVVGALLGVSLFLNLYRTLSPGLAGIALLGVGVPVLVGVAAALYPAVVATRISPAVAVRSE